MLRPISISDKDAMVDTLMSDMDVMYWLPYSDAVSTIRGQRNVAMEYLTEFIKPWEEFEYGVWAVCIRDIENDEPGDFIGYCGFIPEQIKGAGLEIIYAVKKSMWGKGVITEALKACLDYIFTKTEISCIYAVTDKENTASCRVMEKIGMRYEKEVDLYESVAKGGGLLLFYVLKREVYLHDSYSQERYRDEVDNSCK